MNKFKLFIAAAGLFTMVTAQAETLIYAEDGTEFEYSIYERSSETSQYSKTERGSVTTYIEFTETPANLCDKVKTEKCTFRPLTIEVMLEVSQDDGKNEPGYYNVIQRSSMDLVAEATKRNEPDMSFLKMKKGTVKFFNEAKGFGRYAPDGDGDGDDSDGTRVYIPHQQSKEVDEALRKSDKVIIIFRTYDVQEGKKGLNAVNVKKA